MSVDVQFPQQSRREEQTLVHPHPVRSGDHCRQKRKEGQDQTVDTVERDRRRGRTSSGRVERRRHRHPGQPNGSGWREDGVAGPHRSSRRERGRVPPVPTTRQEGLDGQPEESARILYSSDRPQNPSGRTEGDERLPEPNHERYGTKWYQRRREESEETGVYSERSSAIPESTDGELAVLARQ